MIYYSESQRVPSASKLVVIIAVTLMLSLPLTVYAAKSVLLGWNNLGMHCMDSDYSVFSILPPYNTVDAQIIVNGKLVSSRTGYSVTYQAVADPSGSINSTSIGKGNFYQYAAQLYGQAAPDMGLAGFAMPGRRNIARKTRYDSANGWFQAEGIPLTPYDNAMVKNTYPMMRLVAKKANRVMARTDIVLPVSDEMDCRACHASGSGPAAQPAGGWVNDPNAERDYRLNILKLHDERRDGTTYIPALQSQGYNANGLYFGVVNDSQPVLCAHCHLSEALPGSGFGNISPLTRAVHSRHAAVLDPVLNISLDNSDNRAACYRCHPGSVTHCLRGAMGSATNLDGSMMMQCQSCHGTMSRVGASDRTGWFDEPNCQACHTGTATSNNGQIRYTSVFENDGNMRVPVNRAFATTANAPAPGLSLYRFSTGHGGLKCSACHGSTHAEFPSSHSSDNLQSIRVQGHAGVIAECSACHLRVPRRPINGGPHGMHPMDASWVVEHGDVAEHDTMECAGCHGLDYRGTVLSQAQANRVFRVENRIVRLSRGTVVGCYTCHNGPNGGGD